MTGAPARPRVESKICGVRDAETLRLAAEHGADWVGLVFWSRSPRGVTPDEAAVAVAEVSGGAGPGLVGLFVDPTDAELDAALRAVPLALIQLHGAETPERAAAIRARFGRPVMKAIGVARDSDLDALDRYAGAVDRFLLDAKPVLGAELPGGNGASFDWSLAARRPAPRPDGAPWMLAGGLTADNVGAAIRASGTGAVDVSSGVERARGVKDPAKVVAFLRAVRGSPQA